jgi:hypothetical protein
MGAKMSVKEMEEATVAISRLEGEEQIEFFDMIEKEMSGKSIEDNDGEVQLDFTLLSETLKRSLYRRFVSKSYIKSLSKFKRVRDATSTYDMYDEKRTYFRKKLEIPTLGVGFEVNGADE